MKRLSEKKVYSQNGEDGVIESIFDIIGTDSKYAVEIGTQDGTECNTRLLREKGWQVTQFDGDYYNQIVHEEYFTVENINSIFESYGIPKNLDLLSIDIDSNDMWVWNALEDSYKPRVVVIEYNAKIPPTESKSVAYDPELVWNGSDYMGASLKALHLVGKKKGYSLVYCENNGVNAFFVRDDLLNDEIQAQTPEEAYKAPQYGVEVDGKFTGHVSDDRQMIDITAKMLNKV